MHTHAAVGGVTNQKVLVYDLHNLHSADLHIQGILGEDFLEHFDMLIDNVHSVLCLDDSSAMRADVRGPHTPLVPQAVEDGFVLPPLMIVEVRLSESTRPVPAPLHLPQRSLCSF
jgi:hypothetical protein